MMRLADLSTRLALPVLPAAALALLALAGGLDARQGEPPGGGRADDPGAYATDPALAFVDPVITGPVSPQYELVRRQAGCDAATWPNIPAVCFPK